MYVLGNPIARRRGLIPGTAPGRGTRPHHKRTTARTPMTSFWARSPLELPYVARLASCLKTQRRSFFAAPPPEHEEDIIKHELVVRVLASLCNACDPRPASPRERSPNPSQPSSPEPAPVSSPQLLFHHHSMRPSERLSARYSRERSPSADDDRREEEKRERRREKDRVRKRVQREKQRREKAQQARTAVPAQDLMTDMPAQHQHHSLILPPLHTAVALN